MQRQGDRGTGPRGGGRLARLPRRIATTLGATVVASADFTAVLTGTVFTAGGGLALLAPLFPQDLRMQTGPLVALAAAALAVGLGILRWGRRLPAWASHGVLLAGTLSITLAVCFAGVTPAGVALAGFYVFVGLDAGMCLTRAAACCHVLVAVAACAVTMSSQSPTGAFPALVISGTTVVVALGSGWLLRVAAAADTDPLTGLANRRRLDLELQAALERAQRTRSPLSVAVLDIDHFKAVNDTRGHDEGDRLLLAAAQAWRTRLRNGDILARQGGDEFVVVLPGAVQDEALDVVAQLLAAMPAGSTASAGVSGVREGDTVSALISRADAALYAAKRNGRNRAEAAPDQRD
jgi:diguanylate cyclase (GGDEF)-like protein